jgi:hypothetical protein
MGSISEFIGVGGIAIGAVHQWFTFYTIFSNTSKLPNNPGFVGTPDRQFQAAIAAAGGNHY